MTINPSLFTSQNQCWETPHDFFNACNDAFGFTLDACATAENAKVPKFFSEADDGYHQTWDDEIVWMNPPYALREVACVRTCKKKKCEFRGHHNSSDIPGQMDWVQKAYVETHFGKCKLAAVLIPARTDTKIFHDIIIPHAALVYFVKGRLRFVGAPAGAVFPSMLAIFAKERAVSFPIFKTLHSRWPKFGKEIK